MTCKREYLRNTTS